MHGNDDREKPAWADWERVAETRVPSDAFYAWIGARSRYTGTRAATVQKGSEVLSDENPTTKA